MSINSNLIIYFLLNGRENQKLNTLPAFPYQIRGIAWHVTEQLSSGELSCSKA